jgi:hypothetical protein
MSMHNTDTYVCAWVSDDSPISSRFTVFDHVAHTTETRADRAFAFPEVVLHTLDRAITGQHGRKRIAPDAERPTVSFER